MSRTVIGQTKSLYRSVLSPVKTVAVGDAVCRGAGAPLSAVFQRRRGQLHVSRHPNKSCSLGCSPSLAVFSPGASQTEYSFLSRFNNTHLSSLPYTCVGLLEPVANCNSLDTLPHRGQQVWRILLAIFGNRKTNKTLVSHPTLVFFADQLCYLSYSSGRGSLAYLIAACAEVINNLSIRPWGEITRFWCLCTWWHWKQCPEVIFVQKWCWKS